jgi:Cys-rich repeat protein
MEFGLSGSTPTSGKYIVWITYHPSKNQITLGHNHNTNQIHAFTINGLPGHGLHLGDVYLPQIQTNNTNYYLEQTSNRSSTYNLVTSPNEKCLALSPLNPDTLNVTPYNFPINTTLNMVKTKNPITIFSSSGVCPENFTYINGQCATQSNLSSSAAFGIRANGHVCTYSTVGNSLIIRLVPENKISAKIETPDIFRERWFYTDYPYGQNQLTVGQRYPLYTIVNGNKQYISNPVSSTYQLSSTPTNNSLAFTPTYPVNWGDYSLNSSQFQNLNLPGNMALWQNSNVMGTPAVVSSSNQVLAQACVPPCATGQICVNGVCTSPTCSINDDCPSGQVCEGGKCLIPCKGNTCQLGQVCVDGKCQTPCTATSCPAGQTCVNGVCISSTCTTNSQCTGGQVCVGGKCQAPCTANSCPTGQVCVAGKCQTCTQNSQCPTGKICSNGVCVTAPTPWYKTAWFWIIISVIVIILILIILALIFG